MTCFHPKSIYLRGFYPSKCPTDEMLHDLNRPKMHPYTGFYEVKVPCGHCIGCILDKANEWATRCSMETSYWQNNACFITLTYDSNPRIAKRTGGLKYDQNLPINEKGMMTLYKQDFTNFMKRLRKKHKGIMPLKIGNKTKYPIRFFCCGEYGPKGGRPHYHAIIFNWKPEDLKLKTLNHKKQPLYISPELSEIWGHGFVLVGEANYETACYTARYCMKKAGNAKVEREKYWKWDDEKKRVCRRYKLIKGDIEPEFINMSRNGGIGMLEFWKKFDSIKRNNGYIIKGKNKKIPRLMRKKWEEKNWQEYHQWLFEQKKKAEQDMQKMLDKYTFPLETYEEKEKYWLQMMESILLKKIPKLHRDNVEQVNFNA